jgi:predicted ABC-type sugar transport system permease subunit
MSSVAAAVRSFYAFWWDFIIGDDVTLAVGVVLGIAAVAAIHEAGVASWWALPVVWVVALVWSLRRATRRSGA